jgi:thiamine-monophosphate kinase
MNLEDRARTVGELGEFRLIERIRGILSAAVQPAVPVAAGVVLGIGDDAALLRPESGWDWAVTCDVQIAGRHFVRSWTDMRGIGRRAMTVNLSDLAAMGAEPQYALVSLGLDPALTVGDIEDLYSGFLDALAGTKATVVGGNISGTGPDWFCNVTLLGRVETGQALTRSGARPGDRILLSGSRGRSAAGLAILQRPASAAFLQEHPWATPLREAFLQPTARLEVGRLLVSLNRSARPVTAVIDVSDGLFGDLTRLCEASGVRAEIDLSRLPDDSVLDRAAGLLGRPRWEWTLSPGDDYELLFTVAAESAEQVADLVRRGCGLPVADVGVITAGTAAAAAAKSSVPGADLVELLGLPPGAVPPSGWDHLLRCP